MTTRDPDAIVGWVATAGSITGFTTQWLTNYGSVALITINLLLGLGGLYLLALRVIKAHRDIRNDRRDG